MHHFYVHLASTVKPEDHHEDDEGLSGIYRFVSNEDDQNPLIVTSVLNEFHDHIGIRVLDDFEIGVKNEAGEWLVESDNEDDPDAEDLPYVEYADKVEGVALRESQEPPPRSPRPAP